MLGDRVIFGGANADDLTLTDNIEPGPISSRYWLRHLQRLVRGA